MELAVDEFIIDWHLSKDDDERQTVESIIRLIKARCHKLVFDKGYLLELNKKLKELEKQRKNDTYINIIVRRIRLLLTSSLKVRVGDAPYVKELDLVKDEVDRLVIKSALAVNGTEKMLVTCDSKLVKEEFPVDKYRIKWFTPSKAEKRLAEQDQSCS